MRRAIELVTWDDVTKKRARGVTDESDFGEVHEIRQHYVLTQKRVRNKEKFFISKYVVRGFDSSTLWFNASQDQLQIWRRDSPPDYNEYSSYKTQHTPSDIETRIPLIEDPLNVTKRESTSDAAIKESTVNTMTINTPVTQEEIIVERRPASESSSMTPERPVDSKTDMKSHLSNGEIEVTKEPYVKEEVMMKKKLDTETIDVEDSATSKKFDASTIKEELQ
jgi:uncharacterized protein (TIGR02271 family)